MSANPKDILHKYWGYNSFRAGQEAVVADILAGKQVLGLFPTGGGKSICFQVPALMLGGITLVVSPLVSLMKDQTDALKHKDISAIHLHSGLNSGEIQQLMDNAMKGRYKFIYISPERLESENFREYLPSLNIELLVVDEAHCISQWGHDFRPSYLKIGEVIELIPQVKVAAFTASAHDLVQKDIVHFLNLKNCVVHKADFRRPNLHFFAKETDNKSGYILKALSKSEGSAIVFCDTRRETEEMARFLYEHNISCDFYHAGLPADQRTKKQEQWIKGNNRVIVCTNAFGMGVDKPDVRLVIHQSCPASPEAYYQEAGRAGRDGKDSWCILLYRKNEIQKIRENILNSFPELGELKRVYHAIYNYYSLADGAGEGLSYEFDMKAISDRYKIPQLLLLNALKNIEILEYWNLSDAVFSPSRVMVKWPYQNVYEFKIKHSNYEYLIDTLLRSYGGIFDTYVKISESQLARRLHTDEQQVKKDLNRLSDATIIDYLPSGDKPIIYFKEPRNASPVFSLKSLEPLRNSKLKALGVMESYLMGDVCRANFWENYFGGQAFTPCGVCDICKKQNAKPKTPSAESLIIALKKTIETEKSDLLTIMNKFPEDQSHEMREKLRELLDLKRVTIGEDRILYWNN